MLHIIIKCFEGLKAYRDGDGKIRLFRPMMNMNRLNASAVASSLPVSVSKEQVIGNVKWHIHNCVCVIYVNKNSPYSLAEWRVTVIVLSICLSVCLSVSVGKILAPPISFHPCG